MLISCHPGKTVLLVVMLAIFMVSCGQESETPQQGGEPPAAEQPAGEQPATHILDTAGQQGPMRIIDTTGSGEPLPTDDPYYDGWITVASENIVVHYDPAHPHRDVIPRMPAAYISAIRTDCGFLNIPVPTDTIHVYYHVGPYTGRQATRHLYPFAVGDTLHQFPPFYLGTAIMRYLIPRWHPEETAHPFLEHGLLTILDNSGRDCHERTFGLIDSGRFIPLGELAVDEKTNSNREFYQSAEAASFVDFVVFYYGIDALSGLYLADVPFETATRRMFGMTPDSLQQVWLHVIDSVRTELTNTN
ncbi:MAG: hypothetical protein JSW34_12205 [Candidatus Zixiibacteriota bacterium]|nr:MAG: hypothetical protein JSW34_12205 [candidate division Zixibacteria bacterium]